MFTGIITDIGTIRAVEPRGDLRVIIATRYDTAHLAIGASVACSGVCLTVVAKTGDSFSVDVSHETGDCTPPGMWTAGRRLNLERALKVGDELGGHIVTGHVDAVGTVIDVTADGASHRVGVAVPHALAPYIAAKGSVAIDGVSLTVNTVTDQPDGSAHFAVNIIPHTAEWTTFGAVQAGDAVNIEIDTLARYLARMRAVVG